MKIPFIDLKTQFLRLESEIRSGIDAVLEHGQFIMGPEVAELEGELARFAGVSHAVTCANGTDALLMALVVNEVGPGDAVFMPSFTFISPAEVTAFLGATPVFVEIDERSFNLDPASLEAAVQRVAAQGRLRPRGVIGVDLFGLPGELQQIAAVAEAHSLFVVEDAAQSFGATYGNRKVGSLAPLTCTSFFPAKPLGCYGDGGAVLTDDPGFAERLRSIRVHGKGSDKYDNVRIGMNSRLDTLQAAILLPKLRALAEEIRARDRVARIYHEGLADIVRTPRIPAHCASAWAQYAVLSPHRDKLLAELKSAGIPTAVYYPKPLHLQEAFAYLGYRAGELPVSERVSEQVLSLPMHPYLEEATQQEIISVVRSAVRLAA